MFSSTNSSTKFIKMYRLGYGEVYVNVNMICSIDIDYRYDTITAKVADGEDYLVSTSDKDEYNFLLNLVKDN